MFFKGLTSKNIYLDIIIQNTKKDWNNKYPMIFLWPPRVSSYQLLTAVFMGDACLFTLHFFKPDWQQDSQIQSDSRKCKVNKQRQQSKAELTQKDIVVTKPDCKLRRIQNFNMA